ncbi:MAG: hypothetical protein U0N26_06420 [Faecalibacterium prausnitzii]
MEMFVFFTIPAIFIIMMILIPLAIGASALQFILDHIVIISIIIWLPVAWATWTMWRFYGDDDDEKVECVLLPLFLVPVYAGTIQLVVELLNALDNDLWAFFVDIFAVPMLFGALLAVCMGIVAGLMWLHKKLIKSKTVTLALGVLIAAPMTYYLWNLS